jgi:hypothetical protein
MDTSAAAGPGAAAWAGATGALRSLNVHRLERALRERLRYRYVRPQVVQEGEALRIQSPNCSRKVDPNGGVIDIALLVPHGQNRWCLCSRDHAENEWVPRLQNAALDDALDALCVDSERQFWP